MQLSANFLIDSNTFFREQFLLSKNLYNQGRYLINEQYFKELKDEISNYICNDFINHRIYSS